MSSTAAPNVEQLIAIWSRTLNVSPVHPDSNFFDLGGDSLLAVNMFLEIEKETGHHLEITTIYDAPTIAELAALMVEGTQAKFSPLVLLKEGGSGEPLFIVHGVGGTVLDLASVGKQIRSDGPVFAIQARGIDGQDTPLQTIEEMADFYIDAIRAASSGPYRLAGYSFGGVVAHEMARRLKPENVDKLIMLDAFAHPQTWPSLSRKQVGVAKLVRQLRDQAKRDPRQLLGSLIGKLRRRKHKQTEEERLSGLLNWLGAVRPDLPAPLLATRMAGNTALVAFWPKYFPGKITFLRAGKTGPVFPANARIVWQGLAKEMELRTIEGTHGSIVNEHAASTAAAISACLVPPAEQNRQSFAAIPGADTARLQAQTP